MVWRRRWEKRKDWLTCLMPQLIGAPQAKMVKNPLALQETRVQSLGQEAPLQKGTATHSSILT